MSESSAANRLAVVDALVDLGATDLVARDQHLDRARALLDPLLSEDQYLALQRDRDRGQRLATALRRAAERGDWLQVHALARQGLDDRRRTVDNAHLLALGDAVYGPREFRADATALALSGLVVQSTTQLARARDACRERLRFLIDHDPEQAERYRGRLRHFSELAVVVDDALGAAATAADLRQRVLDAAETGDLARVERLSAALIDTAGTPSGRIRVPRPRTSRTQGLVADFPAATVHRARALGLATVSLAANNALNDYLGCSCVEHFAVPGSPLTEGRREPDRSTCGHACPPEVSARLREVLDLLILHPFVTSAGSRYLPWFGAEALLVETFPETDPEVRTGLLDALGLRSRRAASRLTIEDAVRRRTAAVCGDLGLDPDAHAVVLIPFDAYLRLAPDFDWGRQRQWTHFDGYQVTRELHLRALVGGDATYGGAEDLCSVAREYETDHLLARFAIVRRDRFAAREPHGG